MAGVRVAREQPLVEYYESHVIRVLFHRIQWRHWQWYFTCITWIDPNETSYEASHGYTRISSQNKSKENRKYKFLIQPRSKSQNGGLMTENQKKDILCSIMEYHKIWSYNNLVFPQFSSYFSPLKFKLGPNSSTQGQLFALELLLRCRSVMS
jgi:hypothetical protein